MRSLGIFRRLSAVLGLALAAAAVSCAVNPVTGEREFMLLSQSDEVALGKETHPQILRTYGRYADPELEAYVATLGRTMAKLSDRPDLEYAFHVLDSPVVNAFAVPGGYVYLTRGILGYLNNEAELAGVIGHEIGHIAARHSAQQYTRMQAAQLGLGLGMVLSKSFRKYAQLAEFGVGLLFLSFSRANERQADDLGVLYSSKAGYDARHMGDFFITLQRLNPGEDRSGLPSWLSTHPDPPDRIAAIQKAADSWRASNPQARLAVNRDAYLKRLGGVVFGEDPRQGYVEGSVFYHPQLKFQFPVPAGWKVNNTAAQVQIVSPKQDAALVFTMAAESSPVAAAEAFVKQSQAAVVSSEALQVGGFPAHGLVADVTTDEGVIRALSCFIQKEGTVYAFLGYAAKEQFAANAAAFQRTIGQFRALAEPDRLNVKPERIVVRAAASSGTLGQVLERLGVPKERREALGVLNGMSLDQAIPAGTLLKVIERN